MGEPTLVFKADDVGAIIAALTKTHDDVVSQVQAVRSNVSRELVGWDSSTDSRTAQLAFDARLGRGVDDLTAALARVRDALVDIASEAHSAESRNVAILD